MTSHHTHPSHTSYLPCVCLGCQWKKQCISYLLATPASAQHTCYNQVNIGHINQGTLSLWWVDTDAVGNAPVAFLVLDGCSLDVVLAPYYDAAIVIWSRGRGGCEVHHPPKCGGRCPSSCALQGHIAPLHHGHPVCGCGHHRSSWNWRG